MKKSFFNKQWPLCAAMALSLPFLTAACSDDDETTAPTERHWTTDGGLRATDDILFENNTQDNSGVIFYNLIT